MSIIESTKEFILQHKKQSKFVFFTKEIPVKIKKYLLDENMLYSPTRGIYILKKSNTYSSEEVEKHKNTIISMLGGIISGESSLLYHLGKFNHAHKYKIINNSKNFHTYIGEGKNISVNFSFSKAQRETIKTKINGEPFEIETLLSVIINDNNLLESNIDIVKLLLSEDISEKKINRYIQKGFKLSGLSKLAIFYESNGYKNKYNIIKNCLDNYGKRLDTRNIKRPLKQQIKSKVIKEKIDLNSLF